jgi:hypothetical protein
MGLFGSSSRDDEEKDDRTYDSRGRDRTDTGHYERSDDGYQVTCNERDDGSDGPLRLVRQRLRQHWPHHPGVRLLW